MAQNSGDWNLGNPAFPAFLADFLGMLILKKTIGTSVKPECQNLGFGHAYVNEFSYAPQAGAQDLVNQFSLIMRRFGKT